jgi:hypothetical protein
VSSVFDVPQQLVMLLALAVADAEPAHVVPPPAPVAATAASQPSAAIAFRDEVWLEALKCGAGGQELASDASRVFRTSSGKYYVPDEQDRRRVMDLKGDADVAALVTLGFAHCNARTLRKELSREPTAGELYLAHLFGSALAMDAISAAERDPQARFRDRLPDAATAFPELKAHRGAPSTVASTIARLKAGVERQPSGEEVAEWFANSSRMTLGLALKGAVEDDARGATAGANTVHASAASWGWSVTVKAEEPVYSPR